MDYYYALLNSYSLLKKRKFKLSIQEQGDGDSTSLSTDEKLEKLVGSAGDEENKGNLNGVDLWKKDNNIMASDPNAKSSTGQIQTTTIVKDGAPGESPTAKKLWGQIFPEEEKEAPAEEPPVEEPETPEDTGKPEDTGTPEKDPSLEQLTPEQEAEAAQAASDGEQLALRNGIQMEIEGLSNGPAGDSPMVAAASEEMEALLANLEFIQQNPGNKSPEEITRALEAVQDYFKILSKLYSDHDNIKATEDGTSFIDNEALVGELNDFILKNDVSIGDNGVWIGGLCFSVTPRLGSVSLTNPGIHDSFSSMNNLLGDTQKNLTIGTNAISIPSNDRITVGGSGDPHVEMALIKEKQKQEYTAAVKGCMDQKIKDCAKGGEDKTVEDCESEISGEQSHLDDCRKKVSAGYQKKAKKEKERRELYGEDKAIPEWMQQPEGQFEALSTGTVGSIRGTTAEFMAESGIQLDAYLDPVKCKSMYGDTDEEACKKKALESMWALVEKSEKEGKGTEYNQLLSMFLTGTGVQQGDMFANAMDLNDAASIRFIQQGLAKKCVKQGGSEMDCWKQATKVTNDITARAKECATDPGCMRDVQNESRALLLCVAANSGYEADYFGDLGPYVRSVKATGKADEPVGEEGAATGETMTDYGSKADNKDIYCPQEEGENMKQIVKDRMSGMLSQDQKDFYATACGKDPKQSVDDYISDKLDNLMQSVDENGETECEEGENSSPCNCVQVDRELKVFANHSDAKYKTGQIGTDAMGGFLSGDDSEYSEFSKEFIPEARQTLEDCGFDDTSRESAKRKYDSIRTELRGIQSGLLAEPVPGQKGVERLPSEANMSAKLDSWARGVKGCNPDPKGGAKAVTGERAKNQCLRRLRKIKELKTGKPPKGGCWRENTCAGRTSIANEMKAMVVAKNLRAGSKKRKDGTYQLSKESLDYVVHEYIFGNGSKGEVVKVKRELDEEHQSVSLNNAEQKAIISGLQNKPATTRVILSGNTIRMECRVGGSGKWVTRANGSIEERGTMWMSSKTEEAQVSNSITNKPSQEQQDAEAFAARSIKREGPGEAEKLPVGESKEPVLLRFLKGQQALIDDLINRTL